MKKLFLVGALVVFGAVSAQEQGFKAKQGDVTTEFGLTGGLGNTSVNLPDQGFGIGSVIKARYFATDHFAYRLNIFLSNDNKTDKNVSDYTNDYLTSMGYTPENLKTKSFSVGVGLGAEYHFNGTERLSPYVGGDAYFKYASNSYTVNGHIKNDGATKSKISGPNVFTFGVKGVFGADYYFTKRVFLGVEAGLGLSFDNQGKITANDVTSKTDIYTVKSEETNGFTITPGIVSGIRLGYAF